MARIIAAWLFLTAFACLPAGAQEACNKPLRMLAHLPMTAAHGIMTIPVSVNGESKQFGVSTGAIFSQISSAFSDALKLHKYNSPVETYGSHGVSRYYVKADTQLGNLKLPQFQLLISDTAPFDGIFDPTAFNDVDFEFDFSGGKLNLVSADHCDGKVVYWPAKVVAVVPFKWDTYHIAVPVIVDGQNMTAWLNVGSDTSTMSADVAQRKFGLVPGTPDLQPSGHQDGDENMLLYAHPFKTLSFDGVSVSNPHIAVYKYATNPNPAPRPQMGGFSADLVQPQITIGMDVLSKLHMYLALKEKRVYLTEATPPATPALP